MKKLLYIIHICLLLVVISCQRDSIEDVVPTRPVVKVPEGYTYVEFTANIMDMNEVTRAVDPDGLTLNNMTLFCFNEFGLYISSEDAQLKTHSVDNGRFSAVIPNHTHIIHFIGNHSEGLYDESQFPGQTESMVVANMEGGSGMLVYWSRFQMDTSSNKSISEQLQDLTYTVGGEVYKGVKLIRNQAMVTINNWDTEYFHVTGFRTVNIPAFGTVAPHHPNNHFNIVDNWESTDEFVTLPNNQALMSDITDINTKPEDYVFETENSGDKLVSVIIRGHAPSDVHSESNDKYYRVVLQNSDGSNFMLRRNHHYDIHITGMLTYGQDSFEEALSAPASNNAWISIDEWVNEISDGVQTLWVEQTSYVLSSDEYAGTNLVLPYKYTVNGGGDAVAPTITWLENNVAYDNITNTYNNSTGEGEMLVRLFPMYEGNEQQAGTLLIKHGQLQRKISIYIIRTQKFTPSWISSQVFGVADEYVTVVFTIPDTCPEALYPFTVLVSVNHLDVRSESGQRLPVYVKGEEGYFGTDWEGINYKYAYTVTGPGKHRLHMKSILQHEEDELEAVHLEAPFFETITKQAMFTAANKSHRRIFVDDLLEYQTPQADDAPLYYMLAPQKRAHPLVVTLMLQERQTDGSYTPLNHAAPEQYSEEWHKNGKDEFLIYTKVLSDYTEYYATHKDHYEEIQNMAWEGDVSLVLQDLWSTNGRVMAFRTYDYKNPPTTSERYGLQTDGTYNIYLLTNGTNNQDVVRIASNNTLSTNVFRRNRDGSITNYNTLPYEGNEYRSIIFDIGHYRPYRFAAQVRVADADGSNPELIPATSDLMGNHGIAMTPENVDDVYLKYKPGQRVDILFDITSFRGSDGCSVHPFGENFGDPFEVYIDAPMLEIDYARYPQHWYAKNNPALLQQDKLRPHPTIAGRYIYTVDRHREHEREFGDPSLTVANVDEAQIEFNKFGQKVPVEGSIDQSGERKCLPFKKSTITAGGDITITTDKDAIVFWDKTFNVETSHIKGEIYYKNEQGQFPVPHNAFVAFVRLRTGARIGVATIYEDGKFELNLREEYTYTWTDDPIEFYYTDTDGVVYNYTKKGTSNTFDLNTLYNLVKSGEAIVLTNNN